MSAENNALGIYLNKFNDWKYCPPSDHLWTVTFLLAPRGGANEIGTFKTLYNNILKVNNQYNATFSPLWKISTPSDDINFVLGAQDTTIGMFLASEISFNGNSISITDTQSNNSLQYTGWLSYGKTVTGRSHNHAAKIRFFKSNWDITEIFIDRWIAAIGQQGLIEDSSLSNIKANVVITEYAASVPNQSAGVWVPRKKITLLRAFPKNRGESKYDYSPENAGDAKFNLVDFEFDAYQVEYFDVGTTRKSTGGTPGYVSPTTAVGTSMVGRTLTAKDIEGRYPDSK